MEKLPLKTVTFQIRPDQVDELAIYADKVNLSRAHLLRNFIDSGLDDLRLLDKIGFLTLSMKGRDLLSIIRRSLNDDLYEVKDDKLVIDL